MKSASRFRHQIQQISVFNVEEYCISEGWVKVPAGKTQDRKGHPLLIKLKGKVEAFYRTQADGKQAAFLPPLKKTARCRQRKRAGRPRRDACALAGVALLIFLLNNATPEGACPRHRRRE